jgi:hypothetical protein
MEKNILYGRMELFETHFTMYGNTKSHVCYPTFKRLFEEIERRGNPPLNIIETGTAAHGTKSTYLFDAYVSKYGGHFWSVDINPNTKEKAEPFMGRNTTLITMDSIDFLSKWYSTYNIKVDVVYLDSYDIVWENPEDAAIHGLKEYAAIKPAIGKDTLLLIDDTPNDISYLEGSTSFYDRTQIIPGKGMCIVTLHPTNVLIHKYQVLYKF